jgi:hypothetical protein
MKFRAAVGLTLLGLAPASAFSADAKAAVQPIPAPPSEDQIQAEIARNMETARWMMAYDRVAWATTDLLLKESKETQQKISPVWFCMEKDKAWYAFYGDFRSNVFEVAVCYQEVSKDKFEKVNAPELADTARFAAALNLTLPEILESTRRTTVRYNYYVRGEKDGVVVYYLPAFQPDGKLAYGIQHTFLASSTGEKVISHDHYGRTLIGAVPGKNNWVTLEMPECADPTPQALFTMMSYREYFADILTHCQGGYFGIALRNGVLACIRTSPPPDLPRGGPGSPETQAVAPAIR